MRAEGLAPNLGVDLGGIKLANPVVMASGTFGYGMDYIDLVDPASVGAVVVKGTTLRPRAGNPPPRIVETPCGMLNAIGLENPGIRVFLDEYLPSLLDRHVTVIANIAGETVDEYAELAAIIDGHGGVAGIEINISCPNVARGGMHFGADPGAAREVVSAVRSVTSLPVIPKLSPNVADIVAIASACQDAGADAISMINTLAGMAIDVENRCPVLGNVFGGLSGPAIKPVALRMIYQVAREVDIPILGGGGIISAKDALEFHMAGATAVSIGTGTFIRPTLAMEVIEGVRDYLISHDLESIDQIIGAALK
ncbi:MAG TPA: dihydroorotate dehydrogenase [Bacillota bacterium]|nr:dihydroorotate dehydrogenase [Bacillota bacterium]